MRHLGFVFGNESHYFANLPWLDTQASLFVPRKHLGSKFYTMKQIMPEAFIYSKITIVILIYKLSCVLSIGNETVVCVTFSRLNQSFATGCRLLILFFKFDIFAKYLNESC